MDFLKLVKNRYSCRAYEPRNVEKEKLDYVFECVRFAPSAVNRQPWRFRIVESDADRTLLQRCYNREWFTSAPLYVIAPSTSSPLFCTMKNGCAPTERHMAT